ncbi:NAD-dependent epimerase/dehydratase family protein [Streptomyces sp. WAC05292]|uniref:SDR family oxidoreductase n=1 Tax=Streptomyces sp. WAC05292 TaxID=2487418 RepID=UPI000F737FDA|nr:NAD(P)H-binding protein [Streptomyces sp. WAC05292]RSS87550.1 NAD-dependent epimerase/dehydratase family protein [Streptomyces sp. WAC05292]
MSTILVTGGTGTLGRRVTARLRAAGHEVRVLSRRSEQYPVDLRDGTGLDAAMAGAQVVVHCASSPRGGDDAAAGHLIAAARRAGTVTNLVYISIVGVDVVPLGYYRVKHRVERMLLESGLGVTILRTTQFHDLVAAVARTLAKVPAGPVPVPKGVRVQPIAVEEVADRLAGLAVPAAGGRVPDMGGPEVRLLAGWVRAYRGFVRGGNLAPDHAVGTVRFADFLAEGGGRT